MHGIGPRKGEENVAGMAATAKRAGRGGTAVSLPANLRRLRRGVVGILDHVRDDDPTIDLTEAKAAIRTMFDNPEALPQMVGAVWVLQLQLFAQHVRDGKLSESEQHKILASIIANGRGLAHLGIVGGAMKAGTAVNININLTAEPEPDPGDGDELVVV